MSSNKPHNDVQQELEGLSPLLARLRDDRKATETSDSSDLKTLHAIGQSALNAVPLEEDQGSSAKAPTMRIVHRKRRWTAMMAAAATLFVGALISDSVFNFSDTPSVILADANTALSEELIASFEAQTADPIAFLLDDELLYAEENELFFSPAEDVLLDWADDGNVEEALSEEVMFDAIW